MQMSALTISLEEFSEDFAGVLLGAFIWLSRRMVYYIDVGVN